MANTNQSARSSDRLPSTVYLLTGCVAILGSNSLVLGPIAPEVARSLGSSTSAVMAATAMFGLGTAASALLFARHIDRLGAWRVLRIAMAVLAAALLSSALVPYVGLLVAAQILAGLATGVALPAIYSSAAAIAPPGRESRTIGVVLTGWTLSLVVGVSFSAVLADFVQWRAVYAAVAVLAVAAFVVLLRYQQPRAIATESAPMPTEALKIPGVTPLLIACGAFMSAFYGIYGFLGDHLHNHLGKPLSANGLAALAMVSDSAQPRSSTSKSIVWAPSGRCRSLFSRYVPSLSAWRSSATVLAGCWLRYSCGALPITSRSTCLSCD